ncbi:MAG: acetyl-CoA carboxylase biotin carboxylase subunit [Actinobacteria bacterium]|nr:acetyl-CoA carboxylase biotin carboxylase subunit [Actinomycetota bacterium]
MFRKVLVANRGEIARRVLRTCRDLGVATVAVYSDADADEPHVHEADEAVRLGPAPATDSYLRIDRVIEAAQRTGADAIHPGYGFLSENADFAEACADAGVVFIGPSPDVIRLMGDKAAAKRHLEEAGVPVVPGRHGEGLTDEDLTAAADEIGYPVLVKAVAGGGGKGMRAVEEPGGLADALAGARRESRNAFGDDRLIIEKLVRGPRHVEVQVFGDTHGHVIHVLERECSVQRRHQKIVEETPSPAVDADLRQRMGAAAVRAAEAVGYVGAGTVEFLLADSGEFYFLEMNTRLQVEHPVTELVTGLDLVALQLQVAAGEPLGLEQTDIRPQGHALEARLYAEDAAGGFLPQTGPVHRFVVPRRGDVRVDSGVESGSEVTRFYDPMLAKLVVHAPDRDASIERMRWLLGHTTVLGVTTNLDFLAAVLDHDAFRSGDLTTTFVDDHLADWEPTDTPDELVTAVAVSLQADEEHDVDAGDPHSPWRALGPWRTGQVGGWQLTLEDAGDTIELSVTGRDGRYRVASGGTVAEAHVLRVDADGLLHLEIDGHDVPAHVIRDGDDVWAHVAGVVRRLRVVPATRHADPSALAGETAFTSPMPGAVITVEVAEGDEVTAGTTLMVVEAMKMEHPIKAPVDGTVTAVHVGAGDAVDGGTALLEFAPAEDAS